MKVNVSRLTDNRIYVIKKRHLNKEIIVTYNSNNPYSDKSCTLEDITYKGIEIRTGVSDVSFLPYSAIKLFEIKE